MRHIFKKSTKIPPPYSRDAQSLESCLECADSPCVAACEETILKKDEGGIFVDFSHSGCTFCQACALACEKSAMGGAMSILDVNLGATIRAAIKLNQAACLAWHRVLCRSCLDVCETRSINFVAGLYPEVAESCTKCGFCQSICPAGAISFEAKDSHLAH